MAPMPRPELEPDLEDPVTRITDAGGVAGSGDPADAAGSGARAGVVGSGDSAAVAIAGPGDSAAVPARATPVGGIADASCRLSRADLEHGTVRRRLESTALAGRLLSDDDLDRSRCGLLARRPPGGRAEETWVFAYGSLIWNPLFAHVEKRAARVHGYHRDFCLRSHIGRGTPERPGLVLGLERGGCCRGVAYLLPPAEADADLRLLWRREMIAGSYHPRWVKADVGERVVDAIAFVVNHRHPQYAGALPQQEILETLRTAAGMWGSGRDYLVQTLEGLRAHGIVDRRLEMIARSLAG